ncbi:Type I secretion system membrane fusion protein PrsE [Thalassovita gelatinovora]|uniref:Membrane fusion protein (MFP) family protein n=1 Tax=Thalassovita gelatinovora TaxID=53501 RepID=A0A0P1FDW9_THAGE|nr:HlyD family type I secretion periplasmic adaptor subunit [Thalassovita gelatinovora]QIZ81494.1 HlyD family type I secretion periplasmic adaptor subunit [Thalassovita gelatinovora]CUH66344.1 Type I secretion system membrane fusion protein PrsE [Thalassovita gelatinovora]SEQ24217.1 HlyD family secretion protein [Thalassovita gelatinovora]
MTHSVEILEWHHEVPRSIRNHVIFGIFLFIVTFGGFGLWAFRAPLAAAVISQGSFVATGRNKIVQHLEGGIIEAILVSEGDRVEKGEKIIQLQQTAAQADLREMEFRKARLEAAEARVRAEYLNATEIVFLPRLIELAKANQQVAQILDDQKLAFESSQRMQEKELAILENGMGSLKIRSEGYRVQLEAYRERGVSLTEELSDKETLLEEGLIRRPEFNYVRRAVLETDGHIARIASEIEEIERSRLKFQLEIEKLEAGRRRKALDELQAVQAELDTIREKARKAKDVLSRSTVVAPVSGTMVRMYYHSPGGVIESGKPIAEILPSDAPLLIETLVPRTDVDSVRPGQAATVRLSALNRRTTPVLTGYVSYLSADSITDTSKGVAQEVYVAHIDLSASEYARVTSFAPVPGMPADIMIETEARTFFEYLIKPVRDSMSRAFREQ